jgi:hypothetical protein
MNNNKKLQTSHTKNYYRTFTLDFHSLPLMYTRDMKWNSCVFELQVLIFCVLFLCLLISYEQQWVYETHIYCTSRYMQCDNCKIIFNFLKVFAVMFSSLLLEIKFDGWLLVEIWLVRFLCIRSWSIQSF